MTIDGINFNKLPKKTEVNQTSKEAPKGPSVEPEMTEEEKTLMAKIRDSALAGYVLGLMKVTGATLGAGVAAGSLTSCVDQEQNVDLDMTQILEKLDAMMKLQQQQIANQQEMLNYLKEMNSDNKQLIKLVQDIIAQNQEITSIISSIDGTTASIESAMYRIVALLEQANSNDQEFLAKLDAIIAGQGDAADKLDQILQANNEQNQTLINMEKLLESLDNTNKNLYNTVLDFYNDYKNGDSTKSEMLENILNEIKNNGSISSDILAAINNLSQKFESGQITESEMLAQIIELLSSIDSKLDNLKDAVDQIKSEFPDLAGKIDEFIQKYQEGELTEHALLSAILNELKNSTAGDTELNAKLDAILNAINQGQMTAGEALDQIIGLLGQIESNTSAILDAINNLTDEVGKLNANFENNQQAIIDGLGDINDGIGSINGKLDKIIANQEKNNETTLEISQKMDEIYAKLEQLNDKTLTIDQVQDMFGPMYEEIKEYLGNISGNQITVGDLEAALEAHKTDLTTTNGLIETLTEVVKNLNLNGGNTEALDAIAKAIREFQSQSNSNDQQVITNLQELLSKIATMQGSLDAIVTTGNAIKDQFDAAMSSATTYGTKLLDEISKISNNMVNKTAFETYADSYTEYLQKAEQQRQEQLNILSAIFDNMGKGNGGSLTIEQLKEIIPDYTDILNEIKDALGDMITKDEVLAFFQKTDLSTTNGLIETLTEIVKNKPTGNGGSASSADTQELEKLLGEIRDLIKSQNIPTESQWKELIDLIKNINTNTTPSQAPSTRSAGANYYHQGWRYN